MPRRSWEVDFDPAFQTWADSLSQPDAEALLAAIRVLRSYGPTLGRPLVDTVKGSRHKNMKELRPGSTGRTEVRVLFAFDPERRGVLLVGGDKSGDWSQWYRANVPMADERYDTHLRRLETAKAAGRQEDSGQRKRRR
jgi:hypothetical protein